MTTIFFNNLQGAKQCERKDLRLMLWAGDGKHNEVTDIERLPGYDVFLCAGWQENVNDNIKMLNNNQILCILDVENESQMALFHYMFDGCFTQIDSDYNGNTPKLALTDYSTLLAPQGIAYNIEGINGLIMPEENLYGTLELFAPILPLPLRQARQWSKMVLELSKRDDLGPEMVWTSPDLNHPYYKYVKDHQTKFEENQKRRSPAWPKYEETLGEQWRSLSEKLWLTSMHIYSDDEIMKAVTPHLSRFDEFLTDKMEALLQISPRITFNREHYAYELRLRGENILRVVELKQEILAMLFRRIPEGLTGIIGLHPDARRPDAAVRFCFALQKAAA
jgi:hypothetical protein